jgi:hypothetical protein
LGRVRAPAGREASDLAFDQRQFQASDAGWFAGTKYFRHRRPLKIIGLHETISQRASQQLRKLRIRH